MSLSQPTQSYHQHLDFYHINYVYSIHVTSSYVLFGVIEFWKVKMTTTQSHTHTLDVSIIYWFWLRLELGLQDINSSGKIMFIHICYRVIGKWGMVWCTTWTSFLYLIFLWQNLLKVECEMVFYGQRSKSAAHINNVEFSLFLSIFAILKW